MSVLTNEDHAFFRKNGYIVREDLISDDELARYLAFFDRDRKAHGHRWYRFAFHQTLNCDALISTPEFDEAIRQPRILGAVEELMGGAVCFGELSARHMCPYEGEVGQSWHRDRKHWMEHPLRMDYIQVMVYLTDVDQTTHCFSISPESVDDLVLDEWEAQVDRGGCCDIHGPAGTVCLFNVAVLHTATTRQTSAERKSLQTYYGHRDRPYLADASIIPPSLWRDDPDSEVRAFYGNLNDVTKMYLKAFGGD